MNQYEVRRADGGTDHIDADGFEPHPAGAYVFFRHEPDHTPKGMPLIIASYAIVDVKSVRLVEPETEKYLPEEGRAHRSGGRCMAQQRHPQH